MPRSTRKCFTESQFTSPLDFLLSLAAEHTGNELSNLPHLFDYVDGDLVNKFLRNPPAAGEFRFKWDSMVVIMTSNKQVTIRSFGGDTRKQPTHFDKGTSQRETEPVNGLAASQAREK